MKLESFKQVADEKIMVRLEPTGLFTAMVFYSKPKGIGPTASSMNGKTEEEAILNLKRWLYYVGQGDNKFMMPPQTIINKQ